MRLFRILVEIPTLDRLLDRIDADRKTQTEIDALAMRVHNLSAKLKTALTAAEKGS